MERNWKVTNWLGQVSSGLRAVRRGDHHQAGRHRGQEQVLDQRGQCSGYLFVCRFSFTYFLNANHSLSGQPREGLFLLSPAQCEQPPLLDHARKDHQGLKSYSSTTALSTCTSPRCLTWSPLRSFPWSKRLQGRGCMRRKSNKLRKPSRKRMQGKSQKIV